MSSTNFLSSLLSCKILANEVTTPKSWPWVCNQSTRTCMQQRNIWQLVNGHIWKGLPVRDWDHVADNVEEVGHQNHPPKNKHIWKAYTNPTYGLCHSRATESGRSHGCNVLLYVQCPCSSSHWNSCSCSRLNMGPWDGCSRAGDFPRILEQSPHPHRHDCDQHHRLHSSTFSASHGDHESPKWAVRPGWRLVDHFYHF